MSDVKPVNKTAENDAAEPGLAGFSSRIRKLCESRAAVALAPARRIVFALTYRTLDNYCRRESRLRLLASLTVALIIGLTIGYAVIAIPAIALESPLGDNVDTALYGITAITLCAAYVTRVRVDTTSVSFSGAKPRDRLQIGRLERIFGPKSLASLVRFVGLLFGLQTAVIQFTHDHAGIEGAATLGRSMFLSIDNLMYGVLLDFCELYGLGLMDPIEHSWLSGTVFLCFRIGFDLMLVLIVIIFYQRATMSGFFKRFPTATEPNPEDLTEWIARKQADRESWIQHLSDELIFLMVAAEYIQGDDSDVRELGQQWPHLKVQPAVRNLFVDESGELVYSPEALEIVDFG